MLTFGRITLWFVCVDFYLKYVSNLFQLYSLLKIFYICYFVIVYE